MPAACHQVRQHSELVLIYKKTKLSTIFCKTLSPPYTYNVKQTTHGHGMACSWLTVYNTTFMQMHHMTTELKQMHQANLVATHSKWHCKALRKAAIGAYVHTALPSWAVYKAEFGRC